jgi:monofunctional biosynthetic peptidoglycan transglycosylase
MRSKKTPEKKKFRAKLLRILKIARKVLLYFFAFTLLWVIAYRFINPPITWLMIQRGMERKIAGKDWKLEKEWRDFDELSVNLKRAAIGGEDAKFLQHWGFDIEGIQYAWKRNQKSSRVRGGSTISQQTAKNVFLWPGHFVAERWIRKGFETYFTVLIEIFWPKKRILEVYLNVMETGDGIYGAERASRLYFKKSAANLTKSEASLLIAVLPNPLRWSPARPTPYIYHKQYLILSNMKRLGRLAF